VEESINHYLEENLNSPYILFETTTRFIQSKITPYPKFLIRKRKGEGEVPIVKKFFFFFFC